KSAREPLVQSPLPIVDSHLVARGTLFLDELGNREVMGSLDGTRVQTDIVLEHIGDVDTLHDCLPRKLELADPAIHALVGVDVELVRELTARVVATELQNAVHEVHFRAAQVHAVAAEPGNHECHGWWAFQARKSISSGAVRHRSGSGDRSGASPRLVLGGSRG